MVLQTPFKKIKIKNKFKKGRGATTNHPISGQQGIAAHLSIQKAIPVGQHDFGVLFFPPSEMYLDVDFLDFFLMF